MNGQHDDRDRTEDTAPYEALRNEHVSREKAARIAHTPRRQTARKDGRHHRYENWTLDQLYSQAHKVGIPGRSNMSKQALIDALRERY